MHTRGMVLTCIATKPYDVYYMVLCDSGRLGKVIGILIYFWMVTFLKKVRWS